jgi:ketosteroid isomerase-like protein
MNRAASDQLSDIEAVKQVQYAYAYNIDVGNLEGVMSLFTDDAVAEYSVVGTDPMNLDGIRQFLGEAIAGGRMVHQMLMPYVVVDGNKAFGTFYLMYFGTPTAETPPGQLPWIQGLYNNEYVKVGGEWKIRHLRFTALAMGTIQGALPDRPWGPLEFRPPFKYPPPK